MFLERVVGEKGLKSSKSLEEAIVLEKYEKRVFSNLLKILTD